MLDLPGDESPALVNLLINEGVMTRAAVPATLLDLAARGHVEIQHLGGDEFVLRLDKGGGPLTPYEEQVLDHVRSIAHNGEVPGAALTTGPPEQSRGWWRRFSRSVLHEARARGLSRPRWTLRVQGAVFLAAYLVALIATQNYLASAGLAALATSALALLRKEKVTALGEAAARRWGELRDYLAQDSAFCEQPPGGVNIWDRYLAYGAAMGVARGAVRAMPMGSESATEAWSPYGGQWHVVRVDYPKWLPPGWGMKPSRAVAVGMLGLIPVAFIYAMFGSVLWPILDEFVSGWLTLLVVGVFSVPFGMLALMGLRFLGMVVLGAVDAGASTREVTGQVVRMREVLIKTNNTRKAYSVQHYVAVDDGQSQEVDAWLVHNALLGGIRPGVIVTATITPRLGYVERLERSGE